MTRGQLRQLRVVLLEQVPDVIEKLDVALLGILLHRRNESPRHGAGGLGANGRISPIKS